jgi:hypothetical protein
MTDENFEFIFSQIGTPRVVQRISGEEVRSAEKSLPKPMVDFLSNFGRCQFLDGLLNVIHPADLQSVLDLVFEDDRDLGGENAYSFAYSAFGTIYFWHPRLGLGDVNLVSGQVTCDEIVNPNPDRSNLENTIYVPFLLERDSHDLFDVSDKPLFKRALRTLGPLGLLECYGLVPALAFGGESVLENLKRISAREHFAILAQATGFTLVSSDEFGQLSEVRRIGI